MWRKMRILVSAQHALMLAYRAEIYLWVLAHTLPFIMMSVWTTAAGSSQGGNFSMSSIEYARYFLAVYVVRQFSTIWMIYEFEWYVVEGRLSFHLLRPINAVWHYVAAHLGEQAARFPFFIVMVGVFFAVYPQAAWVPTPSSIILGVAAIYAAFALRFALQYCLAMLTFWFERASAIDQLFMLPFLFLSGFIIPIADLPKGLAAAIRYTPFPYMIDFPARILTAKLTWMQSELYEGVAVMAIWFAMLSALGAILWKRGLLRYSGQGA